MEKVLNITSRLEHRRRKEQVEAYREKFEAMQRVLQCSACHFKCAMCGRHMKESDSTEPSTSTPAAITLCESCQSEFDAYRKKSREDENKQDIFWHNDEWTQLWASWLEFQHAIKRFRESFDFNRLTE